MPAATKKKAEGSLSPVKRKREQWGLSAEEFASLIYVTRRWISVLEQGGAHSLPKALLDLVEELEGPAARECFERDYTAFRSDLGEARRLELEKKFFPAGRWCGSPSQT